MSTTLLVYLASNAYFTAENLMVLRALWVEVKADGNKFIFALLNISSIYEPLHLTSVSNKAFVEKKGCDYVQLHKSTLLRSYTVKMERLYWYIYTCEEQILLDAKNMA